MIIVKISHKDGQYLMILGDGSVALFQRCDFKSPFHPIPQLDLMISKRHYKQVWDNGVVKEEYCRGS